MDEFTDKVVLITGAGRGMSRQVALAFASLNAIVAANDINPINLDETASQVQQNGGRCTGFVFDIAKRMPVEGLVSQVMEQFGRIDFLVNHASVQPYAALLEMDEWDFHRTLDVNLGGAFFCMQQVGRVMRQQGGGVMVNLVSAVEDDDIQKGHTAYAASLAGLLGLTHVAASELAAYHIRVNAICRGNEMPWLSATRPPDIPGFRRWQSDHPGAHHDGHSELVSLVLFLCSEAAGSITGQVIAVDRE